MSTRYVVRYDDSERINHWITALLFVLAALSGLAAFHPAFFFFTDFFGGGTWTRILHPFLGCALFLAFLALGARFWRQNLINDGDREWMRASGALLRGEKSDLPPVGKYNAGQKVVFWISVIAIVVLLVTGITFWQPWFADDFPVTLRRFAVLLHALAAFVLILAIIAHVYAAIWVKGTVRAMTRGTVSEAWARQNHPLWFKDMTGGK
ncbi:MAG TPA: formate dehydrogenase subunit gamma [Burkholderiaceae bacterium]|nr:formate dehydrogenase subunit gamma [Burkholderiaceae bacterium]